MLGTPKLQVIEPASIAGEYLVGTATFGPAFETVDLTKQVMPVGPYLSIKDRVVAMQKLPPR